MTAVMVIAMIAVVVVFIALQSPLGTAQIVRRPRENGRTRGCAVVREASPPSWRRRRLRLRRRSMRPRTPPSAGTVSDACTMETVSSSRAVAAASPRSSISSAGYSTSRWCAPGVTRGPRSASARPSEAPPRHCSEATGSTIGALATARLLYCDQYTWNDGARWDGGGSRTYKSVIMRRLGR